MALLWGLAALLGAGASGTRAALAAALGLGWARTTAGAAGASSGAAAGGAAAVGAAAVGAAGAGATGVMLLPLRRTEPERRTEQGRMACSACGESGSSGGEGMVMGELRMLQGSQGRAAGRGGRL